MTVGFLAASVSVLSLVKTYTSHYPRVGFVAYIDTLDHLAHPAALASGYEWLIQKGVHAVIVEDESIRARAPAGIIVLLEPEITPHYFESQNATLSPVRAIHLTHHSKTQDEDIAKILGGVFISS